MTQAEGERGVLAQVGIDHAVGHRRGDDSATYRASGIERAATVDLEAIVVPRAQRGCQIEMGLVARALAHHVDGAARVCRAQHQPARAAQHFHAVEHRLGVVDVEATDGELVVAEVPRGLRHARRLRKRLLQRCQVPVVQLLPRDHADRLRRFADRLGPFAQGQRGAGIGAGLLGRRRTFTLAGDRHCLQRDRTGRVARY
ncbi:hypothetical protein G6F23_013483 [Rhizopus arrhizus]|nr:hypothetical protein G6F23_013483 [Rhizopus arrhizus]